MGGGNRKGEEWRREARKVGKVGGGMRKRDGHGERDKGRGSKGGRAMGKWEDSRVAALTSSERSLVHL
jgi:hypothetical protein